MSVDTIIQAVIAAVALYAAILSTVGLRMDRKVKRHESKLQDIELKLKQHALQEVNKGLSIKLSAGFLATGPHLSDQMLFVTVANQSQRIITVQPPVVRLPQGHTMFWPNPLSDVQFPYPLQAGRSCRVWTLLSDVELELKKQGYSGQVALVGLCSSDDGAEYLGEPWELNLNK